MRFSPALLALAVGLSGACNPFDVGNVKDNSSGTDSPLVDAGPDLADSGTPVGGDDGGGDPDCEPAAALVPDGHHNPGQACLDCHAGQEAGAPIFSIGGTLYSDIGGGTPVTGATIILTDANGTEIKLITGNGLGAGNFWSEDQNIAFPVSARASKCPDTREMTAQLNAGQGSCNQGGCHDANRRMHLP